MSRGELVPYQTPDASWEDVPDEVINNTGNLRERELMKRAKREAIERAVRRAGRLTPLGRALDAYDLAKWMYEQWPEWAENSRVLPGENTDPFAVSKDLEFVYECCLRETLGVIEHTTIAPGTCASAGYNPKPNKDAFGTWGGWASYPGIYCPTRQVMSIKAFNQVNHWPYVSIWVKYLGTSTTRFDHFRLYENLAYPGLAAEPGPVAKPVQPTFPEPMENPFAEPFVVPGRMPRPWNWPVPTRNPDVWPNPLRVPGSRTVSGEPRLKRLPLRQTRRLTITVPPKGPPRLKVREVGPRLPRVPPVGTRERKWVVSRALPYLIFGSVTEGIDAIEALWSALPEHCQIGRGATQKAQDVWRCWDRIDPLKAIENFILMELEDTLVGLPSPRGPRGPGDPFGWETGPWDEGGPQPPGMDFPDSPIDWITDMYGNGPPGLL